MTTTKFRINKYRYVKKRLQSKKMGEK